MSHPVLFGVLVTWVIDPLIIYGIYLLYRGWKAVHEKPEADE